MPYSDLYIHASDFDWFIFGDKIKIHAASAGGEVPKVIQNNIKRNRVTYETVKKMPDIFEKSEIKINDSIIRKFYNISLKTFNTFKRSVNFLFRQCQKTEILFIQI